MTELWKPIVGFEKYEISDRGRCRRIDKGLILKPRPLRGGYLRYALFGAGSYRHLAAHRTVWAAFNGQIPDGMQINHLNGIKTDNRLSNLEVCTRTENIRHYWRSKGYDPDRPIAPAKRECHSGERNSNAKVSLRDVEEIRRLYEHGISQVKLGRMFGITQSAVSHIILRKNWK